MRRRVLAAVIVVLLTGGLWGVISIGNTGDADRVATLGSAQFPAAGPGPTATVPPSTVPPEGVLAVDQSGCSGLGQAPVAPTLTWIGFEPVANGGVTTLRTEGGACLLRLSTIDVNGLAWAENGSAVFLNRAGEWHRVGADGDQEPVADDQVPAGAEAYQVRKAGDRAAIPGGAVLEVHEADGRLGIILRHPDGGSALLADGSGYHGVMAVGSPHDPSAIAWSYVPKASEGGCGPEHPRVTKATNVDGALKLEGTDAEGAWPVLWTPDGRLVLHEEPPGCDRGPLRHWVFADGRLDLLSSAALAVALRPAP